jgi:hypothetical protein
MSRRKAGWKKLIVAPKDERDKSPDPQPGEGRDPNAKPEEKKHSKRKRKPGVPQEGGHSQASISEQENMPHQGGHSQSSNGILSHKAVVRDGGHNQSSTGKHMHYGHFGRYNEQMDP